MFTEKLNKKQDGSVYVIEEELVVMDGKYEGLLEHDNINTGTIKVYTGSHLTGEEIVNVIMSIPGETPWKRHIKLFTDVMKVYVTYETQGDTVEAEDINLLQEVAVGMRDDFEQYKEVGHIDGGTF
jgi:hypothetical protein